MHKIVYIQLMLFAALFSSCEDEPEELQLNDLVNQEYEAKKNRLFAATIDFEEFEAYQAQLDSFNGRWVFWAKNNYKEVKLYLPYLNEQVYWANDSNQVEMAYLVYGNEWYRSNWSKNNPYLKIEISHIDTTLKQLFGKFEGRLYNEGSKDEIFVDRGVFNRVQYRIE